MTATTRPSPTTGRTAGRTASPTAGRTAGRTAADAPLAALLREDALVTGAVGALALLGPHLWGDDVAGWVPRAVGAVLLLVAADLALASRWSGRRLRLATAVCADLALLWVVASVAVLALVDLPASGTAVVAGVAVVTLGFAVAELRALRRA